MATLKRKLPPMGRGFFETLSDEQKARIEAYEGSLNFGSDEFKLGVDRNHVCPDCGRESTILYGSRVVCACGCTSYLSAKKWGE